MNLKTFIDKRGETEIAHALQVSIWTVRSWRLGTRTPRTKKANEIVAMSGGDVSLAEIFAPAIDRDIDPRQARG